jgi:glycosyltransferase involved in cell wall biosynthesis
MQYQGDKTQMTPLHLIDTLGIGGAEQMLVNLLPALAAQGCKPEVAVLRAPFDLEQVLVAKGIIVHRLRKQNKWRIWSMAGQVARIAQERQADIIHAHLLFPTLYTGLARKARLTSAATCVTFHNLAYRPGANKPGPGLRVRRSLNGLATRFGMDGLTAVSRSVAQHYEGALGLQQMQIIPNPILIADKPLNMQQPDIQNRPLRIILPGRLVHEKGHTILIDAIGMLDHLGQVVDVVLAGDGPLRSMLEQKIAQAGLTDRTRFTGPLSHHELLAEVAAADVVAIPSLFEGFGMTAAEALALGKPVVATQTGGLTEVIQNGVSGLLVPPGDPAALAGALNNILTDPGFAETLAKAGQKDVSTRFSADLVAEQMIEFYEKILEKRRR